MQADAIPCMRNAYIQTLRLCCPCCCCAMFVTSGGSGGNSGSSCPFATVGGDEVKQQWQRSNYHAKHQSKGMADKVRKICCLLF